jgi:uncharacterized membrane protein
MSNATNARSQNSSIPPATEAVMSISYDTRQPIAEGNMLAGAVYLLYIAGYFCVIPTLIGVVMAHVKVGEADPVAASHFRFQIRTFWIGVLYFAIGAPLCLVLIGFPILIWSFVWSLVRIVKGGLLILENKPIANPGSWLFG